MATSQLNLNRARNDFAAGDCAGAIDTALSATERFGVRPEPWEILGYCDGRAGQYALARRAMDAARSRDPHNWAYAYGQAIAYGVSGRDARGFAAEALRLNPREPLAISLVRDLRRAGTAARRREVARRAGIPGV
jgi:Flp pilus assembly protein TadD